MVLVLGRGVDGLKGGCVHGAALEAQLRREARQRRLKRFGEHHEEEPSLDGRDGSLGEPPVLGDAPGEAAPFQSLRAVELCRVGPYEDLRRRSASRARPARPAPSPPSAPPRPRRHRLPQPVLSPVAPLGHPPPRGVEGGRRGRTSGLGSAAARRFAADATARESAKMAAFIIVNKLGTSGLLLTRANLRYVESHDTHIHFS